ncbi:MAG: hypothetical protein J7M27_14405 [Candidatus Latescibacteria bacterium]|nr:hypothetical protein [Candidatus Latescibacterota bacterium]
MHTSQPDKLTIFTCPKTHDQVVAMFAHLSKGSVLDMGAGEGAPFRGCRRKDSRCGSGSGRRGSRAIGGTSNE